MPRMITFPALFLLVFACGTEQDARDTRLNRHSVQFETATVSVLSPGPLEKRPYTISSNDKSFTLNSEYFTTELPDLEIAVSWVRQRQGPLNLLGGIDGIMSSLEEMGAIGLKYQTQDATVSGLPALRASATYTKDGEHASESIVVTKNHEAWAVTVFVLLQDKAIARRIVESVDVQAQVTEHITVKVTLAGKIYLNGEAVSFEELKRELQRLAEVNGVVLYYREGGESPPWPALWVSTIILFEIGKVGLPFPTWSEELNE